MGLGLVKPECEVAGRESFYQVGALAALILQIGSTCLILSVLTRFQVEIENGVGCGVWVKAAF